MGETTYIVIDGREKRTDPDRLHADEIRHGDKLLQKDIPKAQFLSGGLKVVGFSGKNEVRSFISS